MASIEIYTKGEDGRTVMERTLSTPAPDLRALPDPKVARYRDCRPVGKPRATGKTERKREKERREKEASNDFWRKEVEAAFPTRRPRQTSPIVAGFMPVTRVNNTRWEEVTDEAVSATVDHIRAYRSRIRAKAWLMETRRVNAHTADAIVARAWTLLTGAHVSSMPR